jgi:hypothetical protein
LILFGFAVGATAGWAAGLLRRPATAPEGSSADEAIRLPREDFGGAPEPAAPPDEPAGAGTDEGHEHAPPRKATAPSVRRSSGARSTAQPGAGGSEPAKPAAATKPAKAAKPAKPAKAAKPAKPAAVKPAKPAKRAPTPPPDPAEAAAAALREGHAEATERLAGAEADATPPPATGAGPARRRRRQPGT